MSDAISGKLKVLRQIDIEKWTATLSVVKRSLAHGKATYKVLGVDIDEALQQCLRADMWEVLCRKFRFRSYEFLSEDQDEIMYTIKVEQTDFDGIRRAIEDGATVERAKSYSELMNSWAYVVRLQGMGNTVYGFRQVSRLTATKRVGGLRNLIWRDQMLVDLADQEIFTITKGFDFLVYSGWLLIAEKHKFETALNFRAGMERIRDEVLAELDQLGFCSDLAALKSAAGSNLARLRRICSISQNGHFKNPHFMRRAIDLNNRMGWGLSQQDGKIIVDETSIDTFLMILDNSRLQSPVNDEAFDAIVKRKIPPQEVRKEGRIGGLRAKSPQRKRESKIEAKLK
jgi:hypothetical protein